MIVFQHHSSQVIILIYIMDIIANFTVSILDTFLEMNHLHMYF